MAATSVHKLGGSIARIDGQGSAFGHTRREFNALGSFINRIDTFIQWATIVDPPLQQAYPRDNVFVADDRPVLVSANLPIGFN